MTELIKNFAPDQRALAQPTDVAELLPDASQPPIAAAAKHPLNDSVGGLRSGMLGFMLAHEQFTVPRLVKLGSLANHSGFDLLATSDHLQPWQANEGHSGLAWITMAAMGAATGSAWMGTTVTCPTLRYNPAVVAEAFASLSQLYPGRVFLGVGSGEALNEQAATGEWPAWQERWDRLIEAIEIIRALWAGQPVSHRGRYYAVDAKLYDPPSRPIPLLAAANGKKSMGLAGRHADGLITDPNTWIKHKAEWEAGAHAAGKDPSAMPVLVEQFVVVGDRVWAQDAAELWRFIPKAFKSYYNIADPAEIQRRAERELPLAEITRSWTVSSEPQAHISRIEELWDSGAWIVNVHSGEPNQRRVLEFYAAHVIPRIRRPM